MHTHLSWEKGIKLRKKKATVGLTMAGLRPHLAASCDGKSVSPLVSHTHWMFQATPMKYVSIQ
jgi:hypothetical protein